MMNQLQGLLSTMRLLDLLDILVVAFFLYWCYVLIRNTRATALLKGLVLLGLFTLVSKWLELHAVSWILEKLMTVLIIALPVVFQPELRRALEQLGRGKFYFTSRIMNDTDWGHVIDDVVSAVTVMSQNQIGALIVLRGQSVWMIILTRGYAWKALFPKNFWEIFLYRIHPFMTEL